MDWRHPMLTADRPEGVMIAMTQGAFIAYYTEEAMKEKCESLLTSGLCQLARLECRYCWFSGKPCRENDVILLARALLDGRLALHNGELCKVEEE